MAKKYTGTVPCCGIYCGGCPHYISGKCNGATNHCEERRCTIYKCCVENKKNKYCFECKIFPCSKFKKFNESWIKIGENLIENQKMIKEYGIKHFLEEYNNKYE